MFYKPTCTVLLMITAWNTRYDFRLLWATRMFNTTCILLLCTYAPLVLICNTNFTCNFQFGYIVLKYLHTCICINIVHLRWVLKSHRFGTWNLQPKVICFVFGLYVNRRRCSSGWDGSTALNRMGSHQSRACVNRIWMYSVYVPLHGILKAYVIRKFW